MAAYPGWLSQELSFYSAKDGVDSVFFGGGTPSLLDPQQVHEILQAADRHLSINDGAEITLEANPESVAADKAADWRRAGVNRISLGLQAMDDAQLKAMDRLHTVREFLDAYQAVRHAGFENVSIDLIYGFPGQSLEAWRQTVEGALACAPDHVSVYALQVEPHTPFAAQQVTVDPDLQARQYDVARDAFEREGLAQYEISNFARPGRECRHNLVYWRQEDYVGLGVGAVGCVDGVRWTNHKTFHAYQTDLKGGRRPAISVENLDDATRRFERLMLGLRLREGIAWSDAWPAAWRKERDALVKRGMLEMNNGRWRIPADKVPLTNQALLGFLN